MTAFISFNKEEEDQALSQPSREKGRLPFLAVPNNEAQHYQLQPIISETLNVPNQYHFRAAGYSPGDNQDLMDTEADLLKTISVSGRSEDGQVKIQGQLSLWLRERDNAAYVILNADITPTQAVNSLSPDDKGVLVYDKHHNIVNRTKKFLIHEVNDLRDADQNIVEFLNVLQDTDSIDPQEASIFLQNHGSKFWTDHTTKKILRRTIPLTGQSHNRGANVQGQFSILQLDDEDQLLWILALDIDFFPID